MKKKDASSLRALRQKRLAERKEASESKKQTYKFTQKEEEKKADVPEILTASVLDPRNVSKTAEVSMHLFDSNKADPRWLVCAGGTPVAEIRLSDQDDPNGISKLFATDQYANSIIESAKRLDMAEVLAGVKARLFIASVATSDVFKSLKDNLEKESKEQLRKAKVNLRGDMINMLNIVTTAQAKNFITENGLKDAIFKKMTAAGIEQDRAVAMIEAGWQEGAQKYFEETFKKATQWMDLSPEAFAEIKEEIMGMPSRTPIVESSDDSIPEATPKQASNIPLTTNASMSIDPNANRTASVSEKDKLREAFGFRKLVRG